MHKHPWVMGKQPLPLFCVSMKGEAALRTNELRSGKINFSRSKFTIIIVSHCGGTNLSFYFSYRRVMPDVASIASGRKKNS